MAGETQHNSRGSVGNWLGLMRTGRTLQKIALPVFALALLALGGCGGPPAEPVKEKPPEAPVPTAAPSNESPATPKAPPVEVTSQDEPPAPMPVAEPTPAPVEPEPLATRTETEKVPLISPPTAKRDSLAGRWVVVLSQQGSDFYVWLVDVALPSGADPEVKLVGTSKSIGASTLKSSKIEGDRLDLAFQADDIVFEFSGRLANGTVRGAISINAQRYEPARCEATQLANLKAFDRPKPAAGQREIIAVMEKAQDGESPVAALKSFVEQFPESPLAMEALSFLVDRVAATESKDDELKAAIEAYRAKAAEWDPRLGAEAAINAAGTLAQAKRLPDYALELLTLAETALGPTAPIAWTSRIVMRRGQLLLGKGEVDEGIKLLNGLRAKEPLNAQLTMTVAEALLAAGKKEDALPLFAELSVLPMMERVAMQMLAQSSGGQIDRTKLPTPVTKALWTELKGSEAGLEEYLEKLYDERLVAFAAERIAPRAAEGGTRVVLCELFTGSECPPCVGADVAVAGLEKTYAPTEVISLRYHQHIPGPDPLVNPQSLQRFEQYQGEGTPMLTVNGKRFEGAGGFMADAEPLYAQLRTQIDETLKEQIGLTLELSAQADAGVIKASAKAGGIEFPENVHLVLVLAEDKVAFQAGNGIRYHEMVARALPVGVEGVTPVEGKLTWEGQIDLNDLKEKLLQYLLAFESESGEELRGKPLDLKALHLVALLQDTKTGEVLQAGAIPVSGSLETTFNPEEAAKAAPKPKTNRLDIE